MPVSELKEVVELKEVPELKVDEKLEELKLANDDKEDKPRDNHKD